MHISTVRQKKECIEPRRRAAAFQSGNLLRFVLILEHDATRYMLVCSSNFLYRGQPSTLTSNSSISFISRRLGAVGPAGLHELKFVSCLPRHTNAERFYFTVMNSKTFFIYRDRRRKCRIKCVFLHHEHEVAGRGRGFLKSSLLKPPTQPSIIPDSHTDWWICLFVFFFQGRRK